MIIDTVQLGAGPASLADRRNPLAIGKVRSDVSPIDAFEGEWWLVHTRPRHEKALAADLESMGISFFLALAIRRSLKTYRTSLSYEERNRLVYLTVAALFPIVGIGLDAFSDLPPMAIWSNLVFSIVCTIAILRYHLLDISIVIRNIGIVRC